MRNRELLDRLTRLAEEQAGIAAKQEGVLGVVISGSIARGDVWEGSDVDLHVLWESGEKRSAIGGFVEGTLINVHDVSAGYMDYITGTMEGFCRNDTADQHICQPTIAEDLRRFPGASDAFYNLFLDFLCFSPQDLVCAQESIQAVHETISILQS